MNDNYITKIFDARSRIKEVTYSLKYKAQALSTIGMQDLSESLFIMLMKLNMKWMA